LVWNLEQFSAEKLVTALKQLGFQSDTNTSADLTI
jgi:hypothetical protein